jgi:ribonuclease VapC
VTVLDASALLAFLNGEPGADRVAAALSRPCRISAVNWAEVLAHRPPWRHVPVDPTLVALTAGDPALVSIVPFDVDHARETARIKAAATGVPLSLGDRACLALGRLEQLPVMTADRLWRSLKLNVKIVVVR